MNRILTFFLLLINGIGFSQTFQGGGGLILDDGSHNYYPLTVSDLLPNVIDTSFGLETVCINLTHTWDDDLIIWLIAPDGTEFELSSRNGGDGDNYTNTCFNYAAETPIYLGGAPFTGTFAPEGFMSMVNNGQDPNGVWTLHILDTWPWADAGEVLDWSITFGNNPAVPFPFSGANLPLVVISAQGHTIPDEPKIMAHMKIISNPGGQPNHASDPPNVYNGWIGIELRGASSQGMPKKSFSLETRQADSSSLNVSLLGMPEENDWVLLGNYADKSLLRNYYTYHFYRKMGHWAPRMEFCEVMIDGEYQGIYLLGEKIKRDTQRVNISGLTLNDTTGPDLTGGYIFKLDWEDAGDVGWLSDFPAINNTNNLKYLFVYPKSENVHPSHIQYIKAYVDSFEYVMKSPNYADTSLGYRQFIDEQSFIDYILMNEVTKNLDGYRLSTFFYKDKNEKICAGPPWDYDLAMGNGDFMEAYLPSGWNYVVQEVYSNQCAFWWRNFFMDSLFQDRLSCRWRELRQDIFNPDGIKAELDSLVQVISPSIDLNFTKWPILGKYVWPNPAPIPGDYPGEIGKLKDWFDLRITWLDHHWTGICQVSGDVFPVKPEDLAVSIYPNPNQGSFQLSVSEAFRNASVTITDMTGKICYQQTIEDQSVAMQVSVRPGVYYLKVAGERLVTVTKFIVVN